MGQMEQCPALLSAEVCFCRLTPELCPCEGLRVPLLSPSLVPRSQAPVLAFPTPWERVGGA